MESIKLLHFADFHLGSDFRNLGRKSVSRRNDLKETFLNIIGICKTQEIQLLLMAGDLFDSWSVSEEYFQLAADGFSQIPQTTVVIAAGNHDPLTPDSVYLREHFWSSNVIILPSRFGSIVVDELSAEIWGASFLAPYAYNSLFGRVVPKKPEYLQIGLIHGTIGSDGVASDYNPISTSQISNSGLDYLALGHIHKPSGVLKAAKTAYCYPGCPEGRGFDELGERGIIIGELSKNSSALEFLPISQRVHYEASVDISEASGSKAAGDKILAQLEAQYGENFENNLYKIHLVGKVNDNISMENIKAFLGSLFYVKLRDRTELDIDLESTAKEISLKGVFARIMLLELESNDTKEIREALKLGLKAFSGKVDYIED